MRTLVYYVILCLGIFGMLFIWHLSLELEHTTKVEKMIDTVDISEQIQEYAKTLQRETTSMSTLPVNSEAKGSTTHKSEALTSTANLVTQQDQSQVSESTRDRFALWRDQHGEELASILRMNEDSSIAQNIRNKCPKLISKQQAIPSPPPDGTYQELISNHTWVLSAHRDLRVSQDTVLVRLFGLSRFNREEDRQNFVLYCQLWSLDGELKAIVRANVSGLYNFGFSIESFQFVCEFASSDYQYNNVKVSIVQEKCDFPSNALHIHDNSLNGRHEMNVSICICGPTKFNYSDYQRFIEWMELNMILGAGRTLVYNAGVSDLMQKVFDYYTKKGSLEVFDVNVPYIYGDQRFLLKGEDPAYGKMSMRHDCIMREMFKTKYVVVIDLDETVVPRHPGTYTLLDMIHKAGCDDLSYILLRNVFFRRNWPDDEYYEKNVEVNEKYRLLSLLKTKRDNYFFPPLKRSKNILKPEHVLTASTHRAWVYKQLNESRCEVKPKYGALHHYRYRTKKAANLPWKEDPTAHKYARRLVSRVRRVYNELRNTFEKYGIHSDVL